MNQEELLQHAIYCARIGDQARGRDYFLEVIDQDPENLVALAWLIDLLDDLEDRIYACEKVLKSKPHNAQLQAKLKDLISQRPPVKEKSIGSLGISGEVARFGGVGGVAPPPTPPNLALTTANPKEPKSIFELPNPQAQAEQLLVEGKREKAKKILRPIGKTEKQNERAWLRLSSDEFYHFQENPLDLAARYEEEGKYDEAITAYHKAAMKINYGPRFDQIYKNIERLEKHKKSGVVYVPPDHSIARLTFGPPLLFFLLMLIHNQMNPFAFTPVLWIGIILTLGGGFLLAVANVRSRHRIWVKLFDDPGGGGSPLARVTLALAGWMLILISFAFLFQISLERLPLVATNPFIP